MYEKSIELLKQAVADELSGVHQYMYFHFHCDDQGLDLISNLFRRTAIEEMMHIERIAERILFLKGEVELKPSHEPAKILDVREMLAVACRLELQSIQDYNQWANVCASHSDSVTRKLFEDLVVDEERHFRQYDDEQGNIGRYGESYLAQQSMERSRNVAAAAPVRQGKPGA
ncbi:MAG: bacterioferritin [Magnetococcales bacterium]|nr:bacterioferritin [Magnetococcales bacterium]